jgi:uncharacterized phage-associated protein
MGLATIDSIDLSRYILARCGSMTHLKLQKLVYYAEAWHLTILGASLIDDEFEAWMHGPVTRKVWDYFKDFQFTVYNQISVKPEEVPEAVARVESQMAPEQIELIADVLSEYGNKSSYYLECLTHSEDPWAKARMGLAPEVRSKCVISREAIREYYSKALYGESPQSEAT